MKLTNLMLTALACAALLAASASCSKKEAITPVDPVTALINGGGGTGGGAHGGSVTVIAFDEQNKARITDANVFLVQGTTVSAKTTGQDGSAVFDNVTTGRFDVTIVKAGFVNVSIFGITASIVAFPLESDRVTVTGTVSGGSSSGTTYSIDFQTKDRDAFSGLLTPKFGEVTDEPTGGDQTWEVEIDKGASDTLVFTETNSSGKIVNRKLIQVGPYTSGQTGVAVTFDNTTGLHEVSGTLNGLNMLTTNVRIVYMDGWTEYEAYSVTGSGVSRTYSIQLPPNRSCGLEAWIHIFGSTANPPQELQVFTVDTGNADNTTPTNFVMTLDMVDITGTFSNFGSSSTFYLVARYGGRQVLRTGTAGLGYTMRIPRNTAYRLGVAGMTTGNVAERGIELSYGPFGSDQTINLDLSSAAPSILTVTSNRVTAISNHGPGGFLFGLDSGDRLVWPPFGPATTVGGSTITYTIRHFQQSDATYTLMLNDEDGSTAEQTSYIRGNILNPAADLGTAMNITFVQVPLITAPLDGATPAKEVTFSWTADGELSGTGMTIIDIERTSTGDKVWSVIVEGTITSVTLPALTGHPTLELQSGYQYSWTANAFAIQDFDFDSFQIDTLKNTDSLLKSGKVVRTAETDEFDFTVN